jgi:hypothetical protein
MAKAPTVKLDKAQEPEVVDPVVDEGDPQQEKIKYVTAHGLRRAMICTVSQTLNYVDDDTAEILFNNPAFYKELYDEGSQKHVGIENFLWADEWGDATRLVVGQRYDRVE